MLAKLHFWITNVMEKKDTEKEIFLQLHSHVSWSAWNTVSVKWFDNGLSDFEP